ncbi:MAG TPA: TonB family protein, partial [Candidatus Deferrimicrobiaceae bacterium]
MTRKFHPAIEGLERHPARTVRRMLLLSVAAHAAACFLGLAIIPLFPPKQAPPPLFVELTDAPFTVLPAGTSAPTSLVEPAGRAETAAAIPLAAVPPRPAGRENPAASRWLEKLDAGISKIPDAPVARKGGEAGGIPVRDWTDGPAKPGDFAPAVSPGSAESLGKQMEELEARVRRTGRPAVGSGGEGEGSMNFGGKGGASGDAIPTWLRDMIRRRVRELLPELEGVYNEAIRRNPTLRGRILIRFRIDPSGKVLRAESAGGDLPDPAFVSTVLETVRRWNFEPTGGREVEVLHPFLFT